MFICRYCGKEVTTSCNCSESIIEKRLWDKELRKKMRRAQNNKQTTK